MTDKQLQEAVDKKLLEMVTDSPQQMMTFMLIEMGKTVLETDAEYIDLKQKSTFDGQRYEISARVKIKKVKS